MPRCFGLVAIVAVTSLALSCSSEPSRVAAPAKFVTAAAAAASADPEKIIHRKWVRLGGAQVVGAPLSQVAPTPNFAGIYQEFEHGVIVYTDDYGAVLLTHAMFQKWQSLHGQTNRIGTDLLEIVGAPAEDFRSSGTHDAARFAAGMIVVPAGTGIALVVYGEAYGRWCLDGADGLFPACGVQPGSLGLPLAEEVADTLPFGSYQVFAGGEIYVRRWTMSESLFGEATEQSAATVVRGAVLQRWNELGRSSGPLGYPAGEEAPLTGNGVVIGSAALFGSGTLYVSGWGAWEVLAAVRAAYERNGGPGGWLGFPISGSQVSASGVVYNDFEGGVVATRGWSGYAFKNLRLHVQRVEAYGPDCIANLCAGVDVFVKMWVNGPGGEIHYERMPSDGNYGGGADVNANVDLTAVARSDFWFKVKMEGTDDDFGPDDALGSFENTYSVDNLWGAQELPQDASHAGSHGNKGFRVHYAIQTNPPYDGPFRATRFWSFHNPKEPAILPKDTYAYTFADVTLDESAWAHPFNRLFYNLVYKKLAKNGNCFGMSLESIFAEKEWSLFTEPIYRYTKEQALLEINIKHGYQVGLDSILWEVDLFNAGAMHDPLTVFWTSLAAFQAGDQPVLSMSTYFGKHGHTVRPYRWEIWGIDHPDTFRIYVADANVEATSATDATEPTFIEIWPDSNDFEYQPPGCTTTCFSGGDWTNSRLFWHPFHLFTVPQVTPFEGIFGTIDDGFVVLLGSGGESTQLSDAAGRTLFEPNLNAPPTRWDEVRQDPSQRLPRLAPVPVLGADGDLEAQLFYGKGKARSIAHDVVGSGSAAPVDRYQWVFNSGALSAAVEAPAIPNVADRIEAKDIGAPGKKVSVTPSANGAEKVITLTFAAAEKHRWARLDQLTIGPGATFTARPVNGGLGFAVENAGSPTQADLTVKAGPAAPEVHVGTLEIPSGTTYFVFDAPDPSLSYTPHQEGNAGWLLAHVTIQLDAVDYSGTGIAAIESGPDGVTWTTYVAPFVYAEEGQTTIYYRARDNEGNQSDPESVVFKIDTRPPLVEVRFDHPTYTRAETFTVHFSAIDPVPGSGLATVAGTLDGTPVSDGDTVDLLWFGLGEHEVRATAEDVAGWSNTRAERFEVIGTLEGLRATILLLRDRGEIDSDGVTRSLLAKVAAAMAGRANPRVTFNALAALQHELSAQSGKHVSERAARLLTDDSRYVQEHLP